MLPPNSVPQNGRPQVVKRPSSSAEQPRSTPSPQVTLQQQQAAQQAAQQQQQQQQQLALAAAAAQGSPVNAGVMLANGKPFVPGPGGIPGVPTPNGALDPQIQQQRMAAARAHILAQQSQNQQAEVSLEAQTAEQRRELALLAQQNGFGNNIQAFIDARNRQRLISMAKLAAAQQAQAAVAGAPVPVQITTPGVAANGAGQPAFGGSPGLTPAQLQLKLPPHAAARLANNPPTPQAQAQRS
jgi:enhancer of polycomb-like protein